MQVAHFRRPLFAIGFVLALIPALAPAAQPQKAQAKPSASPAEKVRNALDQTIPLTDQLKNGATLKDKLDALEDQVKLRFEVDDKAFAAQGQPNVLATDYTKSEPPRVKEVRVKDFLRTLLTRIVLLPDEATYVVVGDTVVITTEQHAPYRWLKQRVNLDCDKEELSSALQKLARDTGTNLVLDARAKEEAKTAVTMHLQDVTLETAAVLLAEASGLKPVRVGNVLFLTTKEHAKAMCFSEIQIDPQSGLPAIGASSPPLASPVPLPAEWGELAGPPAMLK
jgi:hypothetical protein